MEGSTHPYEKSEGRHEHTNVRARLEMVQVTVFPLLVMTGAGAPRELLALRAWPEPVPGARAINPPLGV